MVQRWCR